MFVPRIFIVAGLALIAIAFGASGHGLWWLIPVALIVGGRRHSWYACGPGYHQRNRYHRDDAHAGTPDDRRPDHGPADIGEPAPDPSRDRHEAFPSAR